MSASKKRKYSELQIRSESYNVNSRRKHSKVSTVNAFKHPNDQQQYRSLFKSIKNTEIIKNLNIASCLIQQIAEFSIGQVIKCNNYGDCGSKIVITHQDFDKNGFPTHSSYRFNKGQFKCWQCHQQPQLMDDNDDIELCQDICSEESRDTEIECSSCYQIFQVCSIHIPKCHWDWSCPSCISFIIGKDHYNDNQKNDIWCNHCYGAIIDSNIKLQDTFKKYQGIQCVECQQRICYKHQRQFINSSFNGKGVCRNCLKDNNGIASDNNYFYICDHSECNKYVRCGDKLNGNQSNVGHEIECNDCGQHYGLCHLHLPQNIWDWKCKICNDFD